MTVATRMLKAEVIRRADHWRRSPASAGGAPGHKEWMHFCVLAPDVEVLLNLSLMDERGPTVEVPRVTLLARCRDRRWEGGVERCEHVEVRGGGIRARFDRSSVEFERGAFQVEAQLRDKPLGVSLNLEPLAQPALTSSIELGAGGTMKWLVVPRLTAFGEISVGDRRIRVHGAPAYHDHDWGRFEWGGDFGWEWSVVLGEQTGVPWTLVLQRITDGPRARVLSQGVLLWRGARHLRTLHGTDFHFEALGRKRVGRAIRVPTIMRLAAPGSAADLPALLRASASKGGDTLEVEVEIGDLAQVAIPNDRGLGCTIVTEASGSARVRGRVRGEKIGFEAPAVAEFNRHAA